MWPSIYSLGLGAVFIGMKLESVKLLAKHAKKQPETLKIGQAVNGGIIAANHFAQAVTK
jgi:hypothetical protein